MNDTPSALAEPAGSLHATIPPVNLGGPPVSTVGPPANTVGERPIPGGAKLGLGLLLAIVAWLVYGPALAGDFVYDDLVLVRDNPRLASFSSVASSFLEPHWGFEDPTQADLVGFWRPLTVVTLALGRALGGGEPFAFHAISLLLHLCATLACWRLVSRLLSSDTAGFMAAVLFLVHPVHVESVAWISAVNDPLYAVFALLAIDAFVAWRQAGSRGLPISSGLWLLPGLFAKEQALAVLPIVIVIDGVLGYWRGAGWARTARGYAPLLIATAAYMGLRVFVFASPLGGLDRAAAGFGFSTARSMTFRVELFGSFLRFLAWPVDLCVFRMVRPELPPKDPTFLWALFATTAWIATCLFAWKRGARLALALLLVLPASVAPLIVKFESAGAFPISDRYLYVATFGAAALVVLCVRRCAPRPVATVALLLIAVPLGLTAHARSEVYENEEAFFRAAVEGSPRNPYVRWGMGRVLITKFEVVRDKEVLNEAYFHYMMSLYLGTDYGTRGPKLGPEAPYGRRATELERVINDTPREFRRRDPTVMFSTDDRLQANLGQGYVCLYLAETQPGRDYDAPLVIFEETARMWPNSYHAHTALGTTRYARGEYAEAKQAFRTAQRLNPAHAEVWYNLGLTLTAEQDWDGARIAFEESEKLRPGHLPDLIGIAKAAIEARRLDMAESRLREAMRRHPDSAEPWYWLGMLEAQKRRWQQALTWFDRVIAEQPRHPLAHLQKGKVLYQLQQVPAAIDALRLACEIVPDNFEAHYQVASLLLASQGESERAFLYVDRAYRLSAPGDTRLTLHQLLVEVAGASIDRCMAYAVLDGGRGDFPLALDWIDRALAIPEPWPGVADREGKLAQVHHARARYLEGVGRAALARDSYRVAIALDPDHFWAHHNLALALFRAQEPQPTVAAAASRALELLPSADLQPDLVPAVRGTLEALTKGEQPAIPPMGPALPDGLGGPPK